MCVYCNKGVMNKALINDGYDVIVKVLVSEDEGHLVSYNIGYMKLEGKRINYCPVCGRNLNGVKA